MTTIKGDMGGFESFQPAPVPNIDQPAIQPVQSAASSDRIQPVRSAASSDRIQPVRSAASSDRIQPVQSGEASDNNVAEPKEQSQVHQDEVQGGPHDGVQAQPQPTLSFGQWLKWHWLDILTMAIMGGIGLGVYFIPPLPSRSFPISNLDGNVVDTQNAYPHRHEIIPIWLAALLASVIPMGVFLLMQLRVRSFWDFNNAVLGLLYALITAAVFQVFIKWLIGGLRPNFLAICIPDTSNHVGNGFGGIMYDRTICTNPDKRRVDLALESFPSGHTTAAFAGFVFLYLYLNAKFKVFSDYRPAYWKLVLLYAPILGAVLIGGALTIDEFHHWWDIVAGAIIGTMMALSAYRMVYASIWNHRFNHIPLYPQTPEAPFTEASATRTPVWTRKAGWGLGERVPHSRRPRFAANASNAV